MTFSACGNQGFLFRFSNVSWEDWAPGREAEAIWRLGLSHRPHGPDRRSEVLRGRRHPAEPIAYPARCLQLEDLTLIALQPMPHSTAAAVEKALEEAALHGVPRLIVSDEGTDVRGGIERYRDAHHDQTVATCDLADKGANLLASCWKPTNLARYAARLGTTKAKLQQTSLACFASPTLRPKARFMNLAAPLRRARWCLRALDQPWPVEPTVSQRQQSVLATIDREQLEARLGWLRDYREAIERWSQWHEVIQVVVRMCVVMASSGIRSRRCGVDWRR